MDAQPELRVCQQHRIRLDEKPIGGSLMPYPTLRKFAGEGRIFDVDVTESLRQGSTLDATFTPTASVEPSGLSVTSGAAVAASSIIRGLYSGGVAGQWYAVTWTFRSSVEQTRQVRILVAVE